MAEPSRRSLPPASRRSIKSHTGCQLCKQRRIKCDEQTPSCGPCSKRGVQCPGLARPLRWFQKHQIITQSDPSQARTSQEVTRTSPTLLLEETWEPRNNDDSITHHGHETRTAGCWDVGNLASYILCPSPPAPFETQESILSEYYFAAICPINSCFDSFHNPWRFYVGGIMFSYPLIFQCVMSMSAAHLFQKRTDMTHVALGYRKQAVTFLTAQMAVETPTKTRFVLLLSSILLGMTSSWHIASLTDLVHLRTARILFKECEADSRKEEPNNSDGLDFTFIVGMMAYWEAVVSPLFDQGPEDLNYLLRFCDEQDQRMSYPNPWSGISSRIFVYMAQAGALSRQKLLANKVSKHITSHSVQQAIFSKQYQEAEELEHRLLQFRLPDQNCIKDPGDELTPLDHIFRLTQTYRLSALLQIYLSYPDIIVKNKPNTSPQHFNEQRRSLIITLAISILNIIATIPKGSRVNAFLTLPMLAAGSALQPDRRNKNKYDSNLGPRPATPSLAPTVECELMLSYTAEYIIQNWRSFVRERLEVIHNHLALEAITRASQILELVWQRADSVSFDETTEHPGSLFMVHWMEVMMTEQLESIFG